MRMTARPTHLLFALLTAATLTFGAATAFAAPASERDSAIIGTCTSQQDCQTKCEAVGGYAGECDTRGRCHCAI
ncbi:MAG TPA: hypothetical protein VF142_10955 [Longimicrobium sp.]